MTTRASTVLAATLILCGVSGLWSYAGASMDQKKDQAQDYYAQGKRLVTAGQIDQALPYFQKAVLFDPELSSAYNEIAIIYTVYGWPQRAEEAYLRAIAVSPSFASAYSNLALLYEEQQDFPRALHCWKMRSNMGDPDDPWTRVARRRVQELSTAHPGVYEKVEAGQYPLPEPLPAAQPQETPQPQVSEAAPVLQKQPEFKRPQPVTLFADEKVGSTVSQAGAYALDYLARARQHYANGEYVQALREATIAEYMDPSNQEIASFVSEIRQAILQ